MGGRGQPRLPCRHYPGDVSEHYFTPGPSTPTEERTHHFTIRGRDLTVTTANGVFSADRLDKGTQVLLAHVPDPPEQGTFLDLGCGWGPISLALAGAAPHATVHAVDVNERCVELTARNAVANGLTVHAALADQALASLRQAGTTLDLIWSNPPVRIGKKALHALLTTWLGLLSEQGQAWLVVQRNLGADSLAAWLRAEGWQATRASSSKGYRVLRVTR